MSGYIEVKDSPPVMRKDEEAIEHAERERRYVLKTGNCGKICSSMHFSCL